MKTSLVILFLFTQLLSAKLQAQPSQKITQILLLNATNQNMPWQKKVESGLRSELIQRSFKHELFVENMDVGRFDEVNQKHVMKRYLIQKYKNKHIDIIITLSPSAAVLLSEITGFFINAPRIYLEPGVQFNQPTHVKGAVIQAKLDYEQATGSAINLMRPKKLIVILDTKNDIGVNFYQGLFSVINSDYSHLDVEKWFDLPTEELLIKAKNTSPDSIILFTPIFRQRGDKSLSPYQFVKLLTTESKSPVFSYWNTLLGSGIVGGYLLSGEKIGEQVADSIIFYHKNQFLKAISGDNLSAYYYDWRQLEKFKIASQSLPKKSKIFYYEVTYFEKNKTLIYSAAVTIFILICFLVFVLFLNQRRIQLLKQLDEEKSMLEYRIDQRTKELLIAKEEAERLASVKSEFLANMSHEIRTPMSGIIGLTDILLEKNFPNEYRHYLEKIKYSSDQLIVVINDILDFSKIESGNINLEEFPFSVSSVVDYINTTFYEQAHSKGITFDIVIAESVRPYFTGDVVRINQVLLNLCSNAIKFTSHGKVSVFVESKVLPSKSEFVYLVFTVKDSGIGIEKENFSSLFESFTQADSSTTRNFGGTGLGLAISKRLCQLMGGDIIVKSHHGVGSEFIASMKVRPNNQALIEDSTYQVFDNKFDALIIDDNEDDIKVIENQLTAMGLVCRLCSSAKQAINIIKENKEDFKVIIVDWTMPTMSSETFLARIYNINPQLCKNIIVLTKSSDGVINDMAKKVNIKTILHKPVLTSVLYEAIKASILISSSRDLSANEESIFGIKILVAEDNYMNRLIVTDMLEKKGAQVHLVENGLECIQAVKLEAFDIILMDIHMPVMDGVEASKIIRNDHDKIISNIPIIALTANVMKNDIIHYLSVGINAHIAKPIKAQRLRETIISCLNK